MKRDMDLVRSLMLLRESDDNSLTVEGYDEPTIVAHLELMQEAGLIVAHFLRNKDGIATGAAVGRITWAGHDFIDAARDNTIWAKAKKHVLKPAASFTFGLLLDYLKAEAKHRLGLTESTPSPHSG